MSAVRAACRLPMQFPEVINKRDLGSFLARSSKCEVFALGDMHVVKFYPLGTTAREVKRQIDLLQRVHGAGINAPWVSEAPTRHEGDGRLGAIYERKHGSTITQMLSANPLTMKSVAKLLAREHRRLHAQPCIEGLSSIGERLTAHLEKDPFLPSAQKQKLLALLDQLPDGRQICHGDFCWNNLLVFGDEVTILDWADAGLGDGICDVARTWVAINFNDGTESVFIQWTCRLFSALYVRAYYGDASFDAALFAKWRLVNAALRLRDLPEQHHPRILRFVERELESLT